VIPDLPPPSLTAGADSLQSLILNASIEARGLFFAEIGLEASPGEVVHWERNDFIEVIAVFGSSSGEDTAAVLLNGLPLHLLTGAGVSGKDPDSP